MYYTITVHQPCILPRAIMQPTQFYPDNGFVENGGELNGTLGKPIDQPALDPPTFLPKQIRSTPPRLLSKTRESNSNFRLPFRFHRRRLLVLTKIVLSRHVLTPTREHRTNRVPFVRRICGRICRSHNLNRLHNRNLNNGL